VSIRDDSVPFNAAPTHVLASDRVSNIWPFSVIVLGMFVTVAWMGLLSWLVYRAILMLL
jgi:hypothetical protein